MIVKLETMLSIAQQNRGHTQNTHKTWEQKFTMTLQQQDHRFKLDKLATPTYHADYKA